jgi:aryl-alcohol dehydrogenase-like predicted oxidoreductase
MKYNLLGNTGLRVSELSFGAASFGTDAKQIDDATSLRTVRVVLDLGINLLDVSPYYGITRAEKLLGKGLEGIPRDRYILATKAGRYGPEEFDFSPKRLRQSVEESLRRLRTGYLDILELHDIEHSPLDYIISESIPTLLRLKEEGKTRFIGITGYPLAIFERVLDSVQLDTILSYCHYTLADTTLKTILPLVRGKGVGLISGSPFGMGLFTQRGPFLWHPADEAIRSVCRRAAEYCKGKKENLAKLALQFAIAHKEIPTTLVGSASPERMKQNVEWINEPKDEELLKEVRRILEPIKDRPWKSGLKENN